MKGAVTFTIAFRPFYTSQTLNHWRNVRGVQKYPIIFNVEPSNQTSAQVDHIWEFAQWHKNTTCNVNDDLYGVLVNPLNSLRRTFAETDADFVVLAEEDVEIASDALEYVEFALQKAHIACMWSDKDGDPAAVELRKWFNPWGWAVRRDAWESVVEPTWDSNYSTGDDRGPGGWDCNLGLRVVHEFDLNVAFPFASRSRHIGKYLGQHQDPSKYGSEENPASFRSNREPVNWRWIL